MAISVLNTDAGLSGTTLLNAESTQTITGAKTFDRDPNPPFAVSASSAVVANLDADKVDGVDIATLSANRIPYAASATSLTNSSGFTFDGSTLTFPGQLVFPATQANSAGANTLDDYEEGTWTPNDGSGAGLSLTVAGQYVKIGQLVLAAGDVTYPVTADGSNATIGNLPFTSQASNVWGGVIFFTDETTAQQMTVTSGSLLCVPRTNGGANITNATLSTNRIIFCAVYRASQ